MGKILDAVLDYKRGACPVSYCTLAVFLVIGGVALGTTGFSFRR